jgi:SAM-dependent methyltransferase
VSDPTERFSSRVGDYVKYRPSYPAVLFDALERACGLEGPSVIADVGSGTGIATELLLKRGHRVYAVEPNRAMREAAEALLAERYPNAFTSVDGRAESTGLASESVDLVFAAQAFHWFEPEACRREFRRILSGGTGRGEARLPGGSIALAWNDRSTDASPFLVAYEALLREASVDYEKASHRDTISGAVLQSFFRPNGYRELTFESVQDFDRDGLIGRARSSSYVPGPDHARHEQFFSELGRLYDAYAVNGIVRFEYTTRLFLGRLDPGGDGGAGGRG